MSAENEKVVRRDESRNSNMKIDRSRRSFAKVGVVVPVAMTFASKSVLGAAYHCTVSGMQSGNHSGAHDWNTPCNVGYSPGGWRDNADKCGSGSPNGNTTDWCNTGVVPFSINTGVVETYYEYKCVGPNSSGKYSQQKRLVTKTTITGQTPTYTYGSWSNVWQNRSSCTAPSNQTVSTKTKKYIFKNGAWVENSSVYDEIYKYFGASAAATSFSSIFGGSDSRSVWDVLNAATGSSSGLEWDAIGDYLNARLYESGHAASFGSVYSGISSEDIVNLYKLGNGGSSFYSSSGVLIDSSFNVAEYLIMIHH